MGERYRGGWAVVLGSLLGLLAVIGVSAPAAAGDVTACGNFSSSTDTRFDIKNNITYVNGVSPNPCLRFPANAIVYLNGFLVSGPGYDFDPAVTGIILGDNGFVLGPGIVRQFATCINGGDDVAVETVVLNQCGIGLILGESYKVKEVRIHDCTPSSFFGVAMVLLQGGFIESSIVRACDYGVITGENNKIWNLVITRHSFIGLSLGSPSGFPGGPGPSGAGNAVSRTVISHPRSSQTVGLDYTRCASPSFGTFGPGCQDGSNSVSGHGPNLNIKVLIPSSVVTQPTENPLFGATNCNGKNVDRVAPPGATTGTISTSC
jgi:hypothetical protein